MFDVHPPHSPIRGWRDFLVQLSTITVGLLIALPLEGCVEWLHHQHVMRQAQAGLYVEIKANAAKLIPLSKVFTGSRRPCRKMSQS